MFQFPGEGFEAATGDNECRDGEMADRGSIRCPLTKTRSLSDGGSTPKLSPSPYIFEEARRQSKDDSTIRDREPAVAQPSTPIRAAFPLRGLALHMPAREPTSPARQPTSPYVKPAPLSPKLDHSQIYASPTNILPRRSRGLDFSRAATSLHHSTLANQSSPNQSSPTTGSRAVNIPGRGMGDSGVGDGSLGYSAAHHDRMPMSSSLGSNTHMLSESSSSSDEDECMDEDMEDAYHGTPHIPQTPAATGLPSFQQRQRPRKHRSRRKARGPLGLGFVPASSPHMISRSPPSNMKTKDLPSLHARRESISWAANQLHISGSESDDNIKSHVDGVDSPRPGLVRRVVRRGNLLPKTKGFARIRAALAEENQPVESEFRREAEVIRQVRESDMDLEPRPQPPHSAATTTLSSPKLTAQDMDELTDDAMMLVDSTTGGGPNVSGTFKQQALKNSKGKVFWDTFSETSTGAPRTTPPPSLGSARASSGAGLEDASMGSPSASSNGAGSYAFFSPVPNAIGGHFGHEAPSAHPAPPSAAEITRRIQKRRRDDDFDPASFKRRAVSPQASMSVHNSPVLQSPLQRDIASWGSRPGSVGGDSAAAKPGGPPSESSGGGTPGNSGGGRVGGSNRRIGYQGMVDTNDGITRLSIE